MFETNLASLFSLYFPFHQNHKIPFDTKPPQAHGNRREQGCVVMEQKETPEGLNDGPCGREAPELHAGLCR